MGSHPNSSCRLILDADHAGDPCEDCRRDSALGWMPVTQMGELFSRKCGFHCSCLIEFEIKSTDADIERYAAEIRRDYPGLIRTIEGFGGDLIAMLKNDDLNYKKPD